VAPSHLQQVRSLVGSMLLTVPGAAALVEDADGVVLLRHAESGQWELPGGAVEPAEHPADAVARETFEETGLVVVPERIVAVHGGPEHHIRYHNGDEVAYVTTVFACRRVGGTLRRDGHEAVDLGVFPRRELAGLDVAPWVRRVLRASGAGAPGPDFVPASWRPRPG
jgi:ADP-ribose pyrophosphatase YjhB (NUDIX family)